MRLHYFQHEPFEGPAAIEEWALAKGFVISSTHLYKERAFPNLSEVDWVIIMGGSMSVNDEEQLPWLVEEKEFVKQAIEADRVVIGICLGAQMIANVLGSKVYPNQEKEIGWFPITWEKEALNLPILKDCPEKLHVMHWHGETFDLPNGAIRLASSEACANQAFLYKDKVVGLQFHLEFGERSTEEMITYCSHELREGKYVQSAEDMIAHRHYIPPTREVLFGLLDALL